jgi:hypothetical protein
LCKDFIEKGHHGLIGFTSKPGSGSTFFFEIDFPISSLGSSTQPRKISNLSTAIPLLPSNISPTGDERMDSEAKHVDVLIVDDSSMTRKLLAKTLDALGVTNVAVENGREAVDKLTGENSITCSMVLMDKEVCYISFRTSFFFFFLLCSLQNMHSQLIVVYLYFG